MNKKEFLEALRTERNRWEAVLAEVSEARMTEPGVAGEWSVKDIIAHVTWFEREMRDMVRARALAGSDLWDLPQGQRNATLFEANRARPLEEVLTEARAVFDQLWESLKTLTDEDLNDAGRFADMPADWIPWQIIADNSFEHYPHHISDIHAWLARL